MKIDQTVMQFRLELAIHHKSNRRKPEEPHNLYKIITLNKNVKEFNK
jgi:hypothetical protein